MTDISRTSEERERSPCLSEHKACGMWGGRRAGVDALMACWGLGAWLGVNGLFVQLPLLVQRLPERWKLPASMALAVQLANIGILLYAVLKRIAPRVPDRIYIYLLLGIGALSLALTAFFHGETAYVGGTERSVPFLALTFCSALVGCVSSVLFYPYLRHFREVYLATYLVGEGLSGFVPSALALVQGVGGEPVCTVGRDNVTMVPEYPPARFESSTYLLGLSGLATLSLISFVSLAKCSRWESERVSSAAAAKDSEARTEAVRLRSARWAGTLLLSVALAALANGVLPSVQAFSCMPYGARAYHLAATLGGAAAPAACLAGVWARPAPPRALAGLLAAAAPPLAYILATALLSPEPPLHNQTIGVVLIVWCWVIVSGAVSYARMWVLGWARRGGARGMRAAGAAAQAGSAAGSAALFLLVNYSTLFQQPQPCANVS